MSAGQPKKFKNGKDLIELWRQFCEEIADNNYNYAPTQTRFCKWLSDKYNDTDRKTIYNALNKYFPDIKSEFDEIRADTIAEGTMLGKYQPSMSIFALKNWCKWTDKQEISTNTIDDKTRAEVEAMLNEPDETESD